MEKLIDEKPWIIILLILVVILVPSGCVAYLSSKQSQACDQAGGVRVRAMNMTVCVNKSALVQPHEVD